MNREGRSGWKSVVAIVGLMLVAGCGDSGRGEPPKPAPLKGLSLAAFASCDEMLREIKDALIGEMEARADDLKASCRYVFDGGGGTWDAPAVGSPADDGAEMSGETAGATGTNLQEEGVDEADLVKTDGKTAFAIVGGKVRAVRVWPFSQFGELSAIEPSGTPKGMYLADGRLVVVSTTASSGTAAVIEEVYDVASPAKPILINQKAYPGSLLDSRRIGSKLHLVFQNDIVKPDLEYELGIPDEELPECNDGAEPNPTQRVLEGVERMKRENRAAIETLSLKDLLPITGDASFGGCGSVSRSAASSGFSLLTIVTDDFKGGGAPSSVSILGDGGAVYASRSSLSIAAGATPFGWWSYEATDFEDATVVHRFSLEGGVPAYSGSGKVDGHLVRNDYAGARGSERFSMAQFAMSEYGGMLRIATTVGEVWGGSTSDSRVSVLDVSSPALAKVGEVTGLGKGEKIHAVRFIGDRAYVVTFKKTDPLFVVDLSDPAAPAVAGELHVPGFSTYLHPFDETHIIGLGFGADDMGDFAWTQGLKLALFDVADPASPKEVGHREIGTRGSYSAAIEEHHAFTLDRGRGMIALPVEICEGGGVGSQNGTFSYAGVAVLKADATGTFGDVGKIVTSSAEGGQPCNPWTYQGTDVLRTVIIGDAATAGVITLTTSQVLLHTVGAAMTQIGAVQ